MIQSFMHIKKIQLYGRLINRLIINGRCNQVIYNERTYSTEINKTMKFLDYDVIYTFPYIQHLSVLNKAKRNVTVFTGVSTLTIVCLNLLDFMQTNDCLSSIATSSIMTTVIHAITFMGNNIIGFVYFKKEDQLILSYSNYWGKRINIKTDIQNILPLSETPVNLCSSMYRIVNLKSCEKKLKLSIAFGKIVQENRFFAIFYA